MDQRSVFFVSPIVCLLIALAVASEPREIGHGGGKRPDTLVTRESNDLASIAGSSGQETSLHAVQNQAVDGWPTNVTGSSDALVQDKVASGHEPLSRGERERVERTDNEPQVEQEEVETKEDYEGEDECEDELKALAESHEAMSRDDTKNSNASTATSTGQVDGASIGGAKNFDSHEVITVNDSDEDEASNEAITDEVVDKYDQEVAELLKYKRERDANQSEANRTKTKRVPTVKKELSTQKEILIGSNETQVPKSLLPPEDTLNRLNEKTEAIRRRNIDANRQIKLEDPTYSAESPGEVDATVDNRYSEPETDSPRKLDKRQETVLKDLKSYLLTEYATDGEQRQKLRQPGAREDALVENLLKLLAKLAENSNRWERVQKLLLNTEKELGLSKDAVDSVKHSYESTSTLFPATTRSLEDLGESRKKLKKKKKKQKHRFSTTTLTPVPATPPLLTTTETPWKTTPVQWHLVAEKLFGPPWQQDLPQQTERTSSARYSAPQNPRTLSSIRDLIETNKPNDDPKSFHSEGKSTIVEHDVKLEDQRPLRYDNVESRQAASHIQPREQFVNVYDRSAEPERMPNYDTGYHRLRYNQLLPGSRDFLQRHEEDYQSDSNMMQADSFARNQDYETEDRDLSLSKSWPDVFRYNAPWRAEERALLPTAFEKWSWRQPQNSPKYWPQRSSYLPLEQNYWSVMENEDGLEEEAEADKIWQEQDAQRSWDRERPSKLSPSWQHGERSSKLYDRDQSNSAWEKSKNRSELSRSKEPKEKVVLPQITMKTWNSLTSDPATWPHKLPGAKPWPKDENGKSYNPNADLVKKLGLDKQSGGTSWSKQEAEKSSAVQKFKEEDKHDRIFPSKDLTKEKEMPQSENFKYKFNNQRSSFNDHKIRSTESAKPWTMLTEKGSKDWMKSENMQADDSSTWRRKYDSKNSWTDEAVLPKIQSVGAWVMTADQSTWKPYQIKQIETSDDVAARRWSNARSNKGSWAEKMDDTWMDRSNVPIWPDKTNGAELWPKKSNKPGSWLAKTKDAEDWTSKSNSPDSWKVRGEWLSKPESSSWTSKVGDNDDWPSKGNEGSWSTKANESWASKMNDDVSKYNEDNWTAKNKDEDSGDAWTRKSSEQNGWASKNNDLTPWQQKISDEWSFGKSSSTSTWPAKWKQFAYHRVTAMPISKPGTTSDTSSSKSKNAFVAVSAVSSPKYSGNEWRKIEEETRNENIRQDEQERSSNQLQVGLERPIYAWKKDLGLRTTTAKSNDTDQLEDQLEALRQIDFWTYKENQAEKQLTSPSQTTAGTASVTPTNATSTTKVQRRGGLTIGNSNALLVANRRPISMK